MAIQLTPEQEQRIQAVVDRGAYPYGTQEELETLLLEGLNSGEPIEANDAFWNRLRAETDLMAAEHQALKPGP